MAWTDFPAGLFTSGQILTAAQMNTYVRDNLKAVGDAWTAYTPTWSSLTIGNATQNNAYVAAGKLYIVRIEMIVGSTTTFTGNSPEITLPGGVNMKAAYDPLANLGNANYEDQPSAAAYLGFVSPGSAGNDKARFLLWRSDGTYPSVDTVVTTRPFTWASGDKIHAQFMFEAA
jgi:hypothetical protein